MPLNRANCCLLAFMAQNRSIVQSKWMPVNLRYQIIISFCEMVQDEKVLLFDNE